ncbi:Spindle assembly checkpoint kinase [Mizuhopecten yessoensis]|uniref:Spindle assembly checkpoint kinase n=1 Tax=Mizuhopecten yessoensis TaxID=6573 RepID=A0A210QIB6_MIZYE|nr:Spindle assembly checkpoint kinase [Mizuhopecten yessoensis]
MAGFLFGERRMDYKTNKSVLDTEIFGKRTCSVPRVCGLNSSRWIESITIQQSQRDNVFEKLLDTYNKCLDGDIFVGLGDELYSVYSPNRRQSDGDAWRYVSKQGKGLYEDLVMERNRQDCLADLGIGMETCDVPSLVKQNIYEKMRPMTSAATTQARVSMAEFETQTPWTGINSKDMASQAVQDTMDSGVQARPSAADFGTQAKPNMVHFGTEARPVTAEFSTQAGQMGVDVGIQMTPSDQPPQDQNDHYNTIKVNLKTKKYRVEVEDNGMIITLTAAAATVVHGFVTRSVQFTTSEFDDLIASLKDCGVGTQASLKDCGEGTQEADLLYHQSSPKFDSGDRQGATAAIPKIPHNVIERTKRKSQGDIMRFHKDIPYEGQLEKYLSPFSPFPQYGYIPSRDIPVTLDDIKIPVVQNHDVTYEKTESDSVVLGRGGFGCVYFAKHCTITMDLCVKEYEENCTSLYDIHQEAKLLLYLQSTKFVPQCLGLMVSPFIPEDVSLVQECFAKGYTLKNLLNDRPRSFTDRKWVATVYQLFWGMKMIHEKQVLLNDIKTDNVLIDYQSADMANNIRFIDMGLASFRRGHRFSDDPTYMDHCNNYAAEVRLGHFSTPASDLYAVGYMVNEISETIGIIELDLIAQMCTEEDPDDRSSCQAVLKKLEDILEEM